LEPQISGYIGLKTRCQADHRATEELINAVSVAGRYQDRAAAWSQRLAARR